MTEHSVSPIKNPRLILASKSMARQAMLQNAGLHFETVPSNVDEVEIVEKMLREGFFAPGIALELARCKALAISREYPDALVIGSDQTLDFQGEFVQKALTQEEAREKIKMLCGHDHLLVSAVCVAKGGENLWQHLDDATLSMNDFDDEFLDLYCAKAGEGLTRAVGAYELESFGSWLFSGVKGDFFTVLGMPLLPLLEYLRTQQGITP